MRRLRRTKRRLLLQRATAGMMTRNSAEEEDFKKNQESVVRVHPRIESLTEVDEDNSVSSLSDEESSLGAS